MHARFPVKSGDEGMLLFSDCFIDDWFKAGGQQTPGGAWKHDISDAIFLVGVNSKKGLLTNSSLLTSTEGGIADALSKVALNGAGLITIQNANKNLATILLNLIQGILALQTGTGPVIDASGKVTQSTADLAALLY